MDYLLLNAALFSRFLLCSTIDQMTLKNCLKQIAKTSQQSGRDIFCAPGKFVTEIFSILSSV